jgi:tetratricopeptide (TPR) repeat protein
MLLQNDDFEMARMWYDRACEAGNVVAQINRDTFHKMVAQQEQIIHRCPSEIVKLVNQMQDMADSLKTSETSSGLAKNLFLRDYNMLSEYANQGSITAQRLCTALEHFAEAFHILMQKEPLTEKQENTFVHELSQCFRIEHIVAVFPGGETRQKARTIVDRVLCRCDTESNMAISQLDEDARVCYVTLQFDSRELTLQFLNVCKKKYPKVSCFYETSTAVHGFSQRYNDALYEANQGLEIDPNNCTLLCDKAVVLRLIGTDMDEAIEAYEKFLSVAPKDHRKVPDAYYSMASCYLVPNKRHDSMESVKKFYHQGEEAEKLQLPCFLPYESSGKTLLKTVVYPESVWNIESTPTINRKARLTDPHRIDVITHHRDWQNRMSPDKNNLFHILDVTTREPRLTQKTIQSLIELKPITLREMNPTKDHIYKGYVLSVTIIEGSSSWIPSVHIVVEDEHLDCERMHIYNSPKGQDEHFTRKVFTIGSKMHIINPYLRIGVNDMKSTIRVDDFSSIIMQSESERVVNMCRCCGEANAHHVCSKCKQARYCSKECQTMDWKLYKHKLICKSQ